MKDNCNFDYEQNWFRNQISKQNFQVSSLFFFANINKLFTDLFLQNGEGGHNKPLG